MSIKDIVDVEITIEDQPVTQKGFGVQMILGAHKVFNERARLYTEASDMLEDGFAATDPEYLAATAAFSQTPSPESVLIGRRTVDEVTLTVTTVVNSTVYKTTINDVEFSFTSDASATAAEIATGLVAAINGGAQPVTATAGSGGVYTLVADVLGTAYTVSVDARQTITKPYTASDDIADDLTAVEEYNNEWYALAATTRVSADVQAAALWVQAKPKIFGTTSSDTNILDPESTTDIAYILKNATYDRTFVCYHTDPTEFMECAWLGSQLPTDPGSTTWMFKTLATISAVKLTASQAAAALAKNCNLYQTIGGVNITREGKMASGRFIDVRVGVDWLQARMAERIFNVLVNAPKIPYTDPGITTIENNIRAQLKEGIDKNVLAANPAPDVTVPKAADIDEDDKENRLLPDIGFTAELAGAIHKAAINGFIRV